MEDFFQLISWIFNNNPEIPSMRENLCYKDWGKKLNSLTKEEELEHLNPLLESISINGLDNFDALDNFMKNDSKKVPLGVYFKSCEIAENYIEVSPHASFILSWVSIIGWSWSLGSDLFAMNYGVGLPNPGWTRIPYTYILTSSKLGGLEGTENMIKISYDCLISSKYPNQVEMYLKTYRDLARQINQMYETAISNLVGDLVNEGCKISEPNFRAEIGALCWTLGLVPESQLLKKSSDSHYIPTRRLIDYVVRNSLVNIPYDPLIQYIWLEMKDRPPFNLRAHKEIFTKINLIYNQLMLDYLDFYSPSEAYAKLIISLFRDDLDQEKINKFREMYELIETLFPNIDWSIYLRMRLLAHTLKKHLNTSERLEDSEVELQYQLSKSESVIRNCELHPEWPDVLSKVTPSLFYLNDVKFEKITTENNISEVDRMFKNLESLRASSLFYWLSIIPPFLSPEEYEKMQYVLKIEENLLLFLRGAYFVMMYPILPLHYHRYGMPLMKMVEQSPEDQINNFSPEIGRKEFLDLKTELNELYQKIEDSPKYAQKCLNPEADIRMLLNSLNAHTKQRF